ncbi:uncharacterized protein LOC126811204 [Patella vulgata]|uniref:uncharacterized protein LOC126811204 n=1 Tax=Patella vulgata TaxID=6465 RepID=UPI00217F7FCA|nr:uncharacterized protein LOC126811204 [Patella vulgata]
MPRKSKNIYMRYDSKTLEDAVKSVRNGLSYRKASKKFNIPKTTIIDHLSGRICPNAVPGKPTALPRKIEEEIVKKVLDASEKGFGVTKRQLLLKVARYVKLTNTQTPFNKGIPGNDWWRGFKSRFPEVTLRKPEKLPTSRSRMLNKVVVHKYFQDLGKIISDIDLKEHPGRIWNCDETGMSYEHDPVKVIARKGTKNLPGRTTNNRENITVLGCINAAGACMPPMFIVKGKTNRCLNGFATLDAPNGTIWTYQERAWMNDFLGQEWFNNVFLKHCGPDRPQLLILDSHGSHEVTELLVKARANDIYILALPPHTTHHLQPLDKGIFGPLQNSYNRLCTEFMADHPNHIIDKTTWPRIINAAWNKTMTPTNILSSFRSTGISPFNPSILSDKLYMPSEVYNKPYTPTNATELTIDNLENINTADPPHCKPVFRQCHVNHDE